MGNCLSFNNTYPIYYDKTFNNTNYFSLIGIDSLAKVVDIYDGDTIIIILYIFNNYYKFNVRLANIDCAEMKCKEMRGKAMQARNRLYNMITGDNLDLDATMVRTAMRERLNSKNNIIRVKCENFDKYGRLLCYLYNKDLQSGDNMNDINKSFNMMLVQEKLALQYDGKTKNIEELNK